MLFYSPACVAFSKDLDLFRKNLHTCKHLDGNSVQFLRMRSLWASQMCPIHTWREEGTLEFLLSIQSRQRDLPPRIHEMPG